VLTFAFGELGLMPDDFYALTWNQYILKCQGFFNREKKEWERIGWATWNGMRVHVNKGMPTYKKFMSFIYQDDEIKDMDRIKEQMNKAMIKYLDNARN
jgi:hypothetical protein